MGAANTREPKTSLGASEQVLRRGPANLQRGWEAVGGWLFLTNERLIFEAHKFNVQSGAEIVSLEDIEGVEPAWSKVFGLIPFTPNSVAVTTRDRTERRFVVSGRADWITAVQAAGASE